MASAPDLQDESTTPIAAQGVIKRYGDVAAVDGVDLTVRTGDIYGFLGPNGAGKTTTLRMLLSLIRPDGGSIQLFGRDLAVDPVRALAGVAGTIEEPRLYDYLSGRRNLELLAAFDRQGVGRRAIDEALEQVELGDRAGDRVGEYSQGMRQRLGIASCLVRRPRLLILDEPDIGVDPAGLRFIRDLLERLSAERITILLSSHLLAEVQEVCTRVAVINAGRIAYEGAVADLEAGTATRYRLRATDPPRARDICAGLSSVRELAFDGELVIFTLAEKQTTVSLTRALGEAGVGIDALERAEGRLERLFFQLTGQAGGDGETAKRGSR